MGPFKLYVIIYLNYFSNFLVQAVFDSDHFRHWFSAAKYILINSRSDKSLQDQPLWMGQVQFSKWRFTWNYVKSIFKIIDLQNRMNKISAIFEILIQIWSWNSIIIWNMKFYNNLEENVILKTTTKTLTFLHISRLW